jgi:hypothetical protein
MSAHGREIDRIERLALGAFLAANLLFPLLLFLVGLPKPWRAFDGEESPINWFSTAQCAIVAAIALATCFLTMLGRQAGTDPIPRSWPWALFALGFLGMSADEALQGHERIREQVLKPRGWFPHVDWLIDGDIVLMAYVLAGACFGWFLLAELRRNRKSLVAFGIAVLLIGTSAFCDALAFEFMDRPSVRHVQTIAEELAEIWAQMLFAAGFLWLFFQKLRALAGGAP